jgi:hypothetical protein
VKFATIALATFALVAVAGADVRSYVRVCYVKADKDLQTKNFAAFDKLLRANITPDFKSTEMGQSEDYDKMFASIKQGFATVKRLDVCKTTIQKVQSNARIATFTSHRVMSGPLVGADGKTHKMYESMISTDVWIHVGKAWKLKSMTWSGEKLTLDGKPISTGAPSK